MCGIAGTIGLVADAPVSRMLHRIRHRGPDGCHIWSDDGVVLGHARLSIIDLSTAADQPMSDPETGNVMAFNGEIYNYLELRSEIGSRYPFTTSSDTEVLLAAYRVWGEGALSRLRGMFAFALYDKATRRVLLARDRFGIKPLYYRQRKGVLGFASEIKALLYWDTDSESIEEQRAYAFLANAQLDTDTGTLFRGVYQLPPASCCWVDTRGEMSAPRRYWHFPQQGQRTFDASAEQELVERFTETLSLHLRSDVPVGTFLSGGLDSSSVTAFAQHVSAPQTLHAFSAVLPYHHPENALIPRYHQERPGLQVHTFLLDGKDFFRDIPALLYHHDEPTLDGSMYAHYKLCEMASQAGVKVLLSGSGGDELFGGYPTQMNGYNAHLLRRGRWGDWIRQIRLGSRTLQKPMRELIATSLYQALPIPVKQAVKNWQLRRTMKHAGRAFSVPHYHNHISDPYRAVVLNNYNSWTVPPFLHYEDRNSMAFGVEVRVPFFDHELVEWVLQFAPSAFMSGHTKGMMRKAFRPIVPDVILDQKGKYGFPSPIDHALRHDDEAKDRFYSGLEHAPILDRKEARKMGGLFFSGGGNVSVFWRTLSFLIWHDLFFRHPSFIHQPEVTR